MIIKRRIAGVLELFGERVYLIAGKTINDAAFSAVLFKTGGNLAQRIPLGAYFKKNICAVKTRDKNFRRFHTEIYRNIFLHLCCRSCRKRKKNRIPKLRTDIRNFQVVGTEVVPPLANAMSSVNGNAADRYACIMQYRLRAIRRKRFRRKIYQFDTSGLNTLHCIKIVAPFKRAIQKNGAHTVFDKESNLILHE